MSRDSKIVTAILVVVVGGMIGLFVLANGNDSSSKSAGGNVKAGLMMTTGPWTSNTDQLSERLTALNLGPEGNKLHIHEHLAIFIHGKAVETPKNIGINTAASLVAPLHIHDASGVIHVEAAEQRDFTLGNLMGVWGLKFTTDSIGGYKADDTNKLKVYSNGQLVSGDPAALVLGKLQQIVITFGTDAEEPAPIPATYEFPKDL